MSACHAQKSLNAVQCIFSSHQLICHGKIDCVSIRKFAVYPWRFTSDFYAFDARQCRRRHYVFGLSVRHASPFVRPDRFCYHEYLMNGLSNLDETDKEYSTAPDDDLVRFWRSKVKVTAGPRGGKGSHVDAGAEVHLLAAYIFRLRWRPHFLTDFRQI